MSRIYGALTCTLAAGAGDCEDYAIAKFAALREQASRLTIYDFVIMRSTLSGEDHAVVAARLEGHWRSLDNRYLVILEDVQIRRYHPMFVIDEHEVRRFADAPIVRRTS